MNQAVEIIGFYAIFALLTLIGYLAINAGHLI